jgi:hypothetical protein
VKTGYLLTFYLNEDDMRDVLCEYLRGHHGRPDWANHLRDNAFHFEITRSGELLISVDGEFEEKGLQKFKSTADRVLPNVVKDYVKETKELAGDIKNEIKRAVKKGADDLLKK